MKFDTRLSGILHVLLHMADQDRPLTSEALALAMKTNPVVIRRTMAGLRERGIVRSDKGHGGGWTLGRDLSHVTLLDVYEALGQPSLLAIGNRSDAPTCLVEQSVNETLDQAFARAEQILLDQLRAVTLASIHEAFTKRLHEIGYNTGLEDHHAL
jgi:Rrf2 family protein